MRQTIEEVLPNSTRQLFKKNISEIFFGDIEEIRFRINKPIIIKNRGHEWTVNEKQLTRDIKSGHIVLKKELDETMELITNYSPYAFENEIKNGFITIKGGHRIGIAGETIIQDGKIKTLKNISSINFRLAHEIKNCSLPILEYITNPLKNTVIISPPGLGKTTLLRDTIRNLSEKYTISVIDERSEIAGSYMSIAQNDLGLHTDILDKCPKVLGMKMLLRTMSPQIIAVDEIGTKEDMEAIREITNSGVKILCTLHGKNLTDILRLTNLSCNINTGTTQANINTASCKADEYIFDRYIFLNQKICGKVDCIYDENLNMIYGDTNV